MNMMLARQNWSRESGRSGVSIERLRHPKTPGAVVAVVRPKGPARRRSGGAVPRDINAAVIAGVDPRHDVHAQRADRRTRGIDGDGRGPRVTLVRGVGILEHDVARNDATGRGSLFPD